ncbi:hypothetical protein SAMN04487926_16021 [Paraburkholderia steynii]|uniref:Uncharacterized protein n=1 Tax=Paraburkholderia steynii TaxID=1245441 RepID=A0A7Z7BLT2_9BURK|nr:hypothetical protein [Paraburkholderia steynii]SDJ53866.1 hypothetical protein SAMN04487926_16021 [Paraburkholderia steynii]
MFFILRQSFTEESIFVMVVVVADFVAMLPHSRMLLWGQPTEYCNIKLECYRVRELHVHSRDAVHLTRQQPSKFIMVLEKLGKL